MRSVPHIPATIVCAAALALSVLQPAFATDGAAPPVPGETRLEAVLADFEAYALKSMADWRTPGMAVAIVRGDDVIYEKAFGVKELGKPDPVTTDTIFQIGSTSKAFTAALVAVLVDQGKVRWDDKVTSHLSDFRMYDPWVTGEFEVVDLMAQRSGMATMAIDSLISHGYGRRRVIDSLRYVKPVTSFRSAFAYQNNLWLVAAALVEKHTGKSWEENIRERIFSPLGMTASSCDKKSYVFSDNAATLHHLVDDRIVILPMTWKYMDWPYDYAPAGGINSNVKDMAAWIRMQAANGSFRGKQIIKPESVKFMHAPKTATVAGAGDPEQYYCQGWVHREASPYPITWHNGGTSGSKTMVAFVPEAKLGIVVLSNLIGSKMPESIAFRFFDLYFGNPERDWSKEELEKQKAADEKERAEKPKQPAMPLHARLEYLYAGDYSNDVYGAVSVKKDGERLCLTVGPKQSEIELRHWDKDTFMASWDYFTVREDAGLVTFTAGPDGRVAGMTVEMLNGDGCGVFRRKGATTAPAAQETKKNSATRLFDRLFEGAPEKEGVKAISYLELLQLCASGEKVVIVDVLSSDDYRTGHIPGAISLPVKTITEAGVKAKIPEGSNVVVYCLDYHCSYSDQAAGTLTGYGYRVLTYKGGLDEWQQKGQKLER